VPLISDLIDWFVMLYEFFLFIFVQQM